MGVPVPAATIVEMLESAYDLRSFGLPFGAAAAEDMQAAFERAVEILTERAADRIRRGLYRRDVRRIEDLIFVREPGGGVLARVFRQDPYLRCSYRSEQAELEDNLILLWTLYTASRVRLDSEALAGQAREVYRTLAGNLALTPENAAAGIGRFYSRLGEDERPVHGLCRLILEHLGTFRPNMAALFTAYLAKWLRGTLHDIRVSYEIRYRPNAALGVEAVVSVVSVARLSMIIWPAYEGPPPADAIVRRAAGVAPPPVVILACPVPHVPSGYGGIAVRPVVFDLAGDLARSKAAFLKEIGCAGA